MRKSFVFYAVLVSMFGILASVTCQAQNLDTQKDKVSYTIGWDIGSNLKKQAIDVSYDVLTAGIKDALAGAKGQLTDAQMTEVMTAFQKDLQDKQVKARAEAAVKNKSNGAAFLAKNKHKQGVKTLADGLQYKVIKAGTGAKPKADDTVTVNYKGSLIDGTEFDSSYKRGQPATFPVSGVIKGWTEALQLMKTGSTYEVYIPSELAYGERGAGNVIGPNSTLIFTVELISTATNPVMPKVPTTQAKPAAPTTK